MELLVTGLVRYINCRRKTTVDTVDYSRAFDNTNTVIEFMVPENSEQWLLQNYAKFKLERCLGPTLGMQPQYANKAGSAKVIDEKQPSHHNQASTATMGISLAAPWSCQNIFTGYPGFGMKCHLN